MCGIAGVVGPRASGELARAMSDAQPHRGPDADGVWAEPGVALAHRRLSILDLSDAGRQPMREGDLHIVFNGEIYNYVELREELGASTFQTGSDTEVILRAYRAWGERCVERFIGMFAFALWDARTRTLFCARDHFGVKPFHYWTSEGSLHFASEIKPLLRAGAPREVDESAVHDYLVYAYLDHSERTFFRDVRNLPPAHTMTWREGRVEMRRYWSLEEAVRAHRRAPSANPERELRERIVDSVRLQMRSDVPVGVCLSGGLDSSAIASVATKVLGVRPVNAFTAWYDHARIGERAYAEAVVKDTGVTPHFTSPGPDDLLREMGAMLWHQEEPVGGTSIFAQWSVMKEARRAGMKVLLDGQGADEIFGGYLAFFGGALMDDVARLRFGSLARNLRAMREVHGLGYATAARYAAYAALPVGVRDRLMKRSHVSWLDADFARRHGAPARGRPFRGFLDNHLHEKIVRTLPALLHYEDRNSMAFGIESRVPFLDHRLVAFALSLPPEKKLHNGVTKVAMRDALEGVLMDEVRLRRSKVGFATPEDEWMRGPLRPLVESVLKSDSFRARGHVSPEAALEVYRAHCEGRINVADQVWRWVNLELWMRAFIDPAELPAAPPPLARLVPEVAA